MFGLMKNQGGLFSDRPHWYRLHYCGACKSLGRLYGQRSRMLLNHDAVFLAELLSLLKGSTPENWAPGLQSYNCFHLPGEEYLPAELQYAADINLLLARLKLRDNMLDEPSPFWAILLRLSRKPFRKNASRLARWGLDSDLIRNREARIFQRERELPPTDLQGPADHLAYYATPVAELTGFLFAKGVEITGKEDHANTLYRIGARFAQLIYDLDAWRDLEKDREQGDFNPLLSGAFPLSDQELKQQVEVRLWDHTSELGQLFTELPLEANTVERLRVRLDLNLAGMLHRQAHSCSSVSTGIEKAGIPRFFSGIRKGIRAAGSWLDPAAPLRFSFSYLLMTFLFFHQQMAGAAVRITRPEEASGNAGDWLLLSAFGIFPVIAYFLASYLKNKPGAEKLSRKLERKQKRLRRKLARIARKQKEGKKIKWWVWVLLILALLSLISILLVLLAAEGCKCNSEESDCCCCNNCEGCSESVRNCGEGIKECGNCCNNCCGN